MSKGKKRARKQRRAAADGVEGVLPASPGTEAADAAVKEEEVTVPPPAAPAPPPVPHIDAPPAVPSEAPSASAPPAPSAPETPEALPAPSTPPISEVTPAPSAPETPEAPPAPSTPPVSEVTPAPSAPEIPEAPPAPSTPPGSEAWLSSSVPPPTPAAPAIAAAPRPLSAPPKPSAPPGPVAARPVAAPADGPRVLRVGLDGRSLQGGFREDSGRGIGVYARELMRALAVRRDVALTLWLEPALPGVPKGFVPPGVTIRHYARLWVPLRDRLSSQITVPIAAAGRLHDVFHWLAHVHAPAFPPRRSVITVHDLILEQLAPLYARHRSLGYRTARSLEAMAIRHGGVLVADSEATRGDLLARHGVAAKRVFVAPLGVNTRFTAAGPTEVAAVRKFHDLTAPFVLYLGGIDARKDVPMLLEAFARVRAGRSEPLLLVLAGHVLRAPEYPALMQRARELAIVDALRVLEFVPLNHLAMLLTAARVFAFPSRCEGFGLPPLEAMACGTPVVSTTGGSLGEVLGDAALTVAPGDVAAFAHALARALDDEPLRERLRTLGLARAASFTWTRTAEATLVAYRAAARAKAGA
jgi:glycosyltransferase involved in cell wall biosynthesis